MASLLGWWLSVGKDMHVRVNLEIPNVIFIFTISILSQVPKLLAYPTNLFYSRRKSTRLTAVVGGLVMALAMLFASFANELHQVVIR